MSRKHTNETGFSVVELFLVAVIIIVIVAVGWIAYKERHKKADNPSNVSYSNTFIRLNDSGSTNTPPWVLTVNEDGSGSLTHNTFLDRRGVSTGNKTFKPGTFSISTLQSQLSKLDINNMPACVTGQYPPASEALGSASFGSSASLTYEGKTIADFCQNNATETAISQQLQAIITVANP
jgi:cbb3-type cytochrome oxidase subunit 3